MLAGLAGLLFYAPLHRSSCAMLKLLQDFLDVPSRLETLRILDVRAKTEEQGLVASLEVLVHRVLNMPVMDRILTDFTDHLAAAGAEEDLFGLGATVGYHSGGMKGQEMLEQLRRFMDHLQTCLMDGCGDELRPLVLARYPDMCPDDVDNLVSGNTTTTHRHTHTHGERASDWRAAMSVSVCTGPLIDDSRDPSAGGGPRVQPRHGQAHRLAATGRRRRQARGHRAHQHAGRQGACRPCLPPALIAPSGPAAG